MNEKVKHSQRTDVIKLSNVVYIAACTTFLDKQMFTKIISGMKTQRQRRATLTGLIWALSSFLL